MSVVDTIINWEYLPGLLAILAGGVGALFFWEVTRNGSTTARREARRTRRLIRRRYRALRHQQKRADYMSKLTRDAYERVDILRNHVRDAYGQRQDRDSHPE